jgi:aspartate kinase
MNIIVQKYGGTSVANLTKIRLVARRVKEAHEEGLVAVVVSAMAGDTDGLVKLAHEAAKEPDVAAMDILLATGEQITVSILAMVLADMGVPCEAFTGARAGIVTDENHGRAKIVSCDPKDILRALSEGKVAIVAGFQGVSKTGEITTIGRGGSDTTAVALAAALGARRCEIFTDVEGVFTADPAICKDARLLEKISYEEMAEQADAGAKVLHDRSVEIAARHSVPLSVKPAHTNGRGTMIVPECDIAEGAIVSGITCNTGEAKISIRKVPDKVGVTARIFAPIAKANIDVDLIIQNVSEEGFTELTFTVPKEDLRKALAITEASAREVSAGKVTAAGDIAKISVVGSGMRSHAGIAHRMFSALAREGISIQMIGTSEIKVSMIIDMRLAEKAVRILHDEFEGTFPAL